MALSVPLKSHTIRNKFLTAKDRNLYSPTKFESALGYFCASTQNL
jgi:hypothetical protein